MGHGCIPGAAWAQQTSRTPESQIVRSRGGAVADRTSPCGRLAPYGVDQAVAHRRGGACDDAPGDEIAVLLAKFPGASDHGAGRLFGALGESAVTAARVVGALSDSRGDGDRSDSDASDGAPESALCHSRNSLVRKKAAIRPSEVSIDDCRGIAAAAAARGLGGKLPSVPPAQLACACPAVQLW